MKKVVTINLNGRAYQVEEAGYEVLKTYLDHAEKTLAKNPDKTEILADIEQAIADKCEPEFAGGKNVVSSKGVERVLQKVGPVNESNNEPYEGEERASGDSPRKLYRLEKEGKISGVCAGLAAYFGTDVTIMRMIFVLLLFVTQGFMILVYIALIVAMPEAKNSEQIAEAHGKPGTANEIVDKVKQVTSDKHVATRIGNAITIISQVISRVAVVLMVLSIILLTGFFVAGIWAVLLGELKMQGVLASIDAWKQIAFFTAAYILIVMPLYWLFRLFESVNQTKTATEHAESHTVTISSVVIWSLAMFTVLTFTAVYAESFREFVRRNGGYVKVGGYALCVDESKCASYDQYFDDNGVLQGRDPSKLDPTITDEWR
ncbi:PspC domain-containing protein [Candidatus Saccharibacteria bacterium]|nr:MAG: PspC domain-containing protein [Candidatus Saccharibacteria bacterium]